MNNRFLVLSGKPELLTVITFGFKELHQDIQVATFLVLHVSAR